MQRIIKLLVLFIPNFKASDAGYSLIELAIVLTIISLIGGMSAPFLLQQIEKTRRETTQKHQQEVMESLASYLSFYKTLPCPADPTARGEASGVARLQCSQASHAIGIIPYRTLGLPESVARDGYKNFITYAVEPKLISRPGSEFDYKRFCEKINARSLKVLDEKKVSVIASSEDCIIFVLISHGPTGYGAYNIEGTRTIKYSEEIGPSENENGNRDLTFITSPYSSHKNRLFRQSVVWKTQRTFAGICASHRLNSAHH